MADPVETLKDRLYLARLELNRRERRNVEDVEFGQRVAAAMGREAPWSPATVSLWGAAKQRISLEQAEAIAEVCGVRAGWFAFGEGPMLASAEASSALDAALASSRSLGATPARRGEPAEAFNARLAREQTERDRLAHEAEERARRKKRRQQGG